MKNATPFRHILLKVRHIVMLLRKQERTGTIGFETV